MFLLIRWPWPNFKVKQESKQKSYICIFRIECESSEHMLLIINLFCLFFFFFFLLLCMYVTEIYIYYMYAI